MQNLNFTATLTAIRSRYGSVAECARVYNVSKQALYLALRGARGGRSHPAPVTGYMMDRLRSEGLLVEHVDSLGQLDASSNYGG